MMENSWLINSLFSPALIIASYVAFVKFGPIYMKNRKPYDLKIVLLALNLSQICFNFYLFIKAVSTIPTTGIFCTSKYESTPHLIDTLEDIQYKYIVLKLYDLFDTVLIVLRKKNNQLSFLHVHHHVNLFFFAWTTGKYLPARGHFAAGPGLVFCSWNSLVHTVMYCYYLLTAMSSSVKNSWWKKYITLLQIVQHGSMLTLGVISLIQKDCQYPKIWLSFLVFFIATIMYMFTRFYYENYVKEKKIDEGKAKLKN